MSFRIVELICYLAGGVGIFGGSGPNPFPGTYGGTTSGDGKPSSLVPARIHCLIRSFHIVALAECEDMNGEVHGDNDSTVGCVGMFRRAAVTLRLRPERALPLSLGRPEPAVIL